MPLKGILPAVVSPYREDGSFDDELYAGHIEYLFKSGIDGLYINGATGDSGQMTITERKLAAETAVALGKKQGGASIVHVGSNSTRDSIDLACHAALIGADAVSAMPIANTSAFQLNRYYEDIARASGLPLLVYFIPALTHRDIGLEEMLRLLEIDQVIGFKFSDYNLFYMKRILLSRPDTVVFNGNDEIFTFGILNGAKGGIGMTYNVFPKLYQSIYTCIKKDNLAAALLLQDAAAKYIDYSAKIGIKQAVEFCVGERTEPLKCFRKPFAVEPLPEVCKEDLRQLMAETDALVETVS
jgi:N-acetylneuraminate lyase